jgi:hypothetical protein
VAHIACHRTPRAVLGPEAPNDRDVGSAESRLRLAQRLADERQPSCRPVPTAGSVIGMTIGRNPYASSRKPLTSNQPSSAERNFDGTGVASEGFAVVVCPAADVPESSAASRITMRCGERVIYFA